jgi:DNA-binding transcriptional regulator YiaG
MVFSQCKPELAPQQVVRAACEAYVRESWNNPKVALMQVSETTVLHWEKEATEPLVSYWPAIIGFLRYEPFPHPESLSERMLAFRRRAGLSIKEAARRVGVDEASWSRWERTGRIRSSIAAAKVRAAMENRTR